MSNSNSGITITNLDEATREALAIMVIKPRLELAIRFGSTDTLALHRARSLADKYGYKGSTRTMKGALRFIEILHAAVTGK